MLYAVVGDGSGNLTEIRATLEDLRTKATADDAEFWFVVQAKEEPNKTEAAIMKWLQDNEIYFEVVGNGTDKTYEGAQEYHQDEDRNEGILRLLQANEGEGVALLALFVDTEADDEADAELYGLVETAVEAGVEVRLLNGQMVRLQLSADEEAEAEVEAAEAEVAPEPGEELEGEPEAVAFTEAELKKMTVPELTAIAKGQGLSVPKGSSKGDIIAAVLGAPIPTQLPAEAPVVSGASTAGAMLVVMLNGTVHIKPISSEEALALMG